MNNIPATSQGVFSMFIYISIIYHICIKTDRILVLALAHKPPIRDGSYFLWFIEGVLFNF